VSGDEGSGARFVPAAGRRGLTRFYDTVLAITTREGAFRSRLSEQVLAALPAEATIADVGAGTGTLAIALAAAAPRARIVAIEPDPEARAIAREKPGAAAVEWQVALADELPLAEDSCDRVVMSLVLHHLDRAAKRAALTEAHRVLKPEGTLHIADWGPAHDPLMRTAFFTLQLIDGFAGTADHAAGRLPGRIEEAGFGEVRAHDRLRTAWGSLELLSAGR
jgi:ubiquinone/menaquinone biosynthesis C-methylase UbiE